MAIKANYTDKLSIIVWYMAENSNMECSMCFPPKCLKWKKEKISFTH